mgnify:CR=1 FL=1
MTAATTKQFRRFTGIVMSDKMNKAIVVRVDRTKTHPQYQKKFVVSRRFSVHDPKNSAKVGDTVLIEECRPISKTIRWRLITIVKSTKEETA